MKNYKISIIVPVYNVENYVEKCIESLINQTYRNIEIILIDDGSTDCSKEICDSYARKDDRIKVVHKKHGGFVSAVSARKAGAEQATGNYICCVDSDDWIEQNRISNFVKHGAITDADMIYMDGYYKDYNSRRILCESEILEGLYCGKQVMEEVFPMIISTKVCFRRDVRGMQVCWGVKTSLFQKMMKEIDDSISMGEDYAHTLQCLLEADSVFLMREHGYHYVERTNSISHSLNRNSLDGVKTWTQAIRKQMEAHNCEKQLFLHMLFLEMWYVMNCDYSILLEGKQDYLYPYPEVKKGSRIAVYGAGTVGTQLIKALSQRKDYQVSLWVDKYSTQSPIPEYTIENISRLLEVPFDYVLIAVLDIKIVEEIEEALLESGIPKGKIAKMDASVINDDALTVLFNQRS